MVVNKAAILSLPVLIAGGTLISTAAISLLIWIIKKHERVYTRVGKVKMLYFFPVKSLKGIEVPELQSTELGVEFQGIIDRSYMLVSDEHVLVSQRQEPKLTLLTVSVVEHTIVITDPDGKILQLNPADENKNSPTQNKVNCRVHKNFIPTVDCEHSATQFFQDYLGRKDVRLVRYAIDLPIHKYDRDSVHEILKKNKPVIFQDLSQLNVLNQSSVDDLNTRIETDKVSVLNFRPNVLIDDAPPFAEDNWKHIKFSSGAVVNKIVPCGRCILTTNNPETGIKTNKEPLVTLRKFRMLKDTKLSSLLDHSPCLGLNCWLQKGGKIAVGDEISAVIEEGYYQYKIK